MPPYKIRESFSWMTPEFKVATSAGKHTIRIKGVAMRSDVTSRNNRKYIDEELVKAARTFYEKPVTINHDMTKKVGTVKWMEYENGCLEYIADINKQPYVDLLRSKSADIKGVSIEALYLHNICPKCGQKFYSEEEYHNHMQNTEYLKNYETTEPHGIVGQALSLVLSPEEPGYTGTTIELMEKYQKPVSQLLETVIKTAKEKETMTQTSSKVPYKIKEQAEIPPEDEKKKEDEDEDEDEKKAEEIDANTGEQSEGEPEKLSCPEGYHLVTDDTGNQTCEPDLPAPPMDNPTATEAADVEPMANAPVGDGTTVTTTDSTACPIGQHRDPETGLCVADDELVEPAPNTNPAPTATETVKLPPFLRLGEPFAGYTSMDDCIAKNPDKDDPAAFCSSIMKKAEGEPASEVKETKDIYETAQTLRKRIAEIDSNGMVRDARTAGTVNKLIEANAKTYKLLQEIDNKNAKMLADTTKKIAEYAKTVEKAANFNLLTETKKQAKETTKLHNSLVKQANVIVEALNKNKKTFDTQIGEVKTSYSSLQEYTKSQLTTLATSIAETNKSINTIKEQVAQFNAKVTEQKTDFETILAAADKNATEMKDTIKSLEEWKKETEQKLTETKQQEAEKNKLTEALEPLYNKFDNLEAKLHGNFKQQHQTKTSDPEPIKDTPYEE